MFDQELERYNQDCTSITQSDESRRALVTILEFVVETTGPMLLTYQCQVFSQLTIVGDGLNTSQGLRILINRT